jgi:methyl-accepting chemotaxis protein
MKKIIGFLGVMALANLTGCATHGFVRTQVDPLAERLGKLEAQVSRLNEATEANKAAVAQANDKAQQTLDAANKAAGEVKSANEDAQRAEAAAQRSENAANQAEQAAKKSEKIFKLGQKK